MLAVECRLQQKRETKSSLYPLIGYGPLSNHRTYKKWRSTESHARKGAKNTGRPLIAGRKCGSKPKSQEQTSQTCLKKNKQPSLIGEGSQMEDGNGAPTDTIRLLWGTELESLHQANYNEWQVAVLDACIIAKLDWNIDEDYKSWAGMDECRFIEVRFEIQTMVLNIYRRMQKRTVHCMPDRIGSGNPSNNQRECRSIMSIDLLPLRNGSRKTTVEGRPIHGHVMFHTPDLEVQNEPSTVPTNLNW